MSRSKEVQQLYNSRLWKFLRQAYLQEHPLCERCKAEGYVTAAVDVHHKEPIESFPPSMMAGKCYDWRNLQALCIPCHIKTHQEMKSHTKEAHKQREDDRLQQWIERQKRPK